MTKCKPLSSTSSSYLSTSSSPSSMSSWSLLTYTNIDDHRWLDRDRSKWKTSSSTPSPVPPLTTVPTLTLLGILIVSFVCCVATTFIIVIIHHQHSNDPSAQGHWNLLNRSMTIDADHVQSSMHHMDIDDLNEWHNVNQTTTTQVYWPKESDQRSNDTVHRRRVKRGVISLASMINCITGCNPLAYKDYGCYCGFQGDGYPVDGIDRCCYMHDMCYSRTDCHQALVYFVSYKWRCQSYGRAKCGYVYGGSSKSICAFQLCECDRRFAKCLTRYRCPHSKPSCDKHVNIIIGK